MSGLPDQIKLAINLLPPAQYITWTGLNMDMDI